MSCKHNMSPHAYCPDCADERIAELEAENAELCQLTKEVTAGLEAELDRAANEIHRLGAKSSQQEDTIAELREAARAVKSRLAQLNSIRETL